VYARQDTGPVELCAPQFEEQSKGLQDIYDPSKDIWGPVVKEEYFVHQIIKKDYHNSIIFHKAFIATSESWLYI